MSDSISSIPTSSVQSDQKTPEQLSEKPAQGVAQLSPAEQQKASLNVSILESAAVIIGVTDDPLSLVLSSAIDKLNEILTPEFGENSIQKSLDTGLDVSPEATAERIVSLSTAFYEAFKAQHPGEDESEVLTNFIETISSGIERGFGEARDILEGLDVLEGDIASNIDQTFELVQEKLAAFDAMIRDMNGLSGSARDDAEQLESLS